MIDNTLSQILNEVYRLTAAVQQAAQEIQQLRERISDLENQSGDKTDNSTE